MVPRTSKMQQLLYNKEKKVVDIIRHVEGDKRAIQPWMIQPILDKCLAEHNLLGVTWLLGMAASRKAKRETLFWYKVLACHMDKGIRGMTIPLTVRQHVKLDDNMILLFIDLWCRADDCDSLIHIFSNFSAIFKSDLPSDMLLRAASSPFLSTASWLRILPVWKDVTPIPPPESILCHLVRDYSAITGELIRYWERCWGTVSLRSIESLSEYVDEATVSWLARRYPENSLLIMARRELFVKHDFRKFGEIATKIPYSEEYERLLLHYFAAAASIDEVVKLLVQSHDQEVFFSEQLVELVHIASRGASYLPHEEDILSYLTAVDNIQSPVTYSVTPAALNALLASVCNVLQCEIPVNECWAI
eukprot:TRINITY_DN13203_c0_g2_i1.p1 TRINITY_DN13203_c0_g2~~TRINITY_DN13203_c0_g2_i1.p1  ORF type:complete len:361 (+),score=36.91 TRINITY_DN13203_c0_g2_i1:1083-2165(+)